jgi:hypothetical protein
MAGNLALKEPTSMQPELALKAISHTLIAIFLITLLFVLLRCE